MKTWLTIIGTSMLIVAGAGGIAVAALWLKWGLPTVVAVCPQTTCPTPAPTYDLRVRRGTDLQSYEGSIDSGGANICIGPHVTMHDVFFHTFTEDDGGWYGTEISGNCPEEKGTGL